VVALLESLPGRYVADRAVGEFGDHGLFERRALFDREAEFDEDFAGEADPGEVRAEGDHLDFDGERLPGASRDVGRLERLHLVEELGGWLGAGFHLRDALLRRLDVRRRHRGEREVDRLAAHPQRTVRYRLELLERAEDLGGEPGADPGGLARPFLRPLV